MSNNYYIYSENFDIKQNLIVCKYGYNAINENINNLLFFSEKERGFISINKNEIKGIICFDLKSFPIVPKNYIKSLTENFKNIEYIDLGSYNYEDLEFLHEFHLLKSVSFYGDTISRFDISKLNLISLSIKNSKNIVNLSDCSNLKFLYLNDNNMKTKLDFTGFPKIERLSLSNININLGDTSFSGNLKSFELSRVKDIENLDFLMSNKTIREVYLSFCPKLSDIDILGTIKNLEVIKLEGFKTIKSIKFIKQLERLKYFKIIGNTNIIDTNIKQVLRKNRLNYFFVPIKKNYDITIDDLIR